MNEIEKYLELDNLIDKLAFANTPYYLYKNFQRNQSVLSLSEKLETEVLIKHFISLKEVKEKSMAEWAVLYALIVAISFKPHNEARKFFEDLKNDSIRWSTNISEIYFSNVQVIHEYNFDLKYKMHSNLMGANSANNTTIIIKP